jgi:hypothetical protein
MSWFNELMGGTPGSSTQSVETWVSPQYSFTEPRMQLTSDFISQNIQRMMEGKYPAYYEKALPTLRESMSRPLRETTFGTPGYRGQSLMGQAGEEGAMYGLGPKSTVARKRKVMSDYATKEGAIDEYLTKLGVDLTSQAATNFTQLSNQMPQGPNAQPVTLTNTTEGTEGIGNLLGMAASAYLTGGTAPWLSSLISGGMGMLSKKSSGYVPQVGNYGGTSSYMPRNMYSSGDWTTNAVNNYANNTSGPSYYNLLRQY